MKVRAWKSCIRPEPVAQDRRELVLRITGTTQHINGDFDEDRFILCTLHIDERFTSGNAGCLFAVGKK